VTEHPSDPDARAVLQESEPFQALRDKLVDQVFARTRERRYESGEVLIHQGVQGDALLVLVDGTVRVVLHDDTGRELMLARSKRGAVVGEMSLITQGPATADVVAETPVRALVLTASDFNELASRNPELTIVLTNLVADRLGRDLVDGLGGKTLSGYRIERCLGRGGMAVVYEATELETGERVALKMMSHRLVYQPGAFSRFEREARIVEPLAHPNIARLRGHFPAFRTEFIVMGSATARRSRSCSIVSGRFRSARPSVCSGSSHPRSSSCTLTTSCTSTSSRVTSCSPTAGRSS